MVVYKLYEGRGTALDGGIPCIGGRRLDLICFIKNTNMIITNMIIINTITTNI